MMSKKSVLTSLSCISSTTTWDIPCRPLFNFLSNVPVMIYRGISGPAQSGGCDFVVVRALMINDNQEIYRSNINLWYSIRCWHKLEVVENQTSHYTQHFLILLHTSPKQHVQLYLLH